jgi:ribonucleoside-diphosphate reductase beta chain
LVIAAEIEEKASYLATQQVDEARHMQFYARIQDEVIAAPDLISERVARSRAQARRLIHRHLRPGARRRTRSPGRQPGDLEAKVAFITTYHLVIESLLGLTAFEFITRYLREKELLPGFVDGYSRIHHDEQRHIGYGIWYLRHAARRPELAEQIRTTLRELLPAAANALAPDREGTDWEALGATGDAIVTSRSVASPAA